MKSTPSPKSGTRCGILALLLAGAANLGVAESPPSRSTPSTIAAADRLQDRSTVQRKIVEEFSGHLAPTPGTGVRSAPDERAAAAEWLVQRLTDAGFEAQRHAYRLPNVNGLVDLLMPPLRGTNVHVLVEASEPDAPYVVIGAHYDSDPGSPGAGDNAAGVAVVFTLGQALLRRPERAFNYLLVFFDQEEDDEVGSKAFARYLHAQGYEVHAVHITDLPGWDDDGDGVVEVQSPTPTLERQYRAAAERLGIELKITSGGSSDNKSFLAAGFPTVGVFGDVTRHLHKPTDTVETVDFGFMERLTSLMLEVLTDADREARRNAQ